MVIGVFEHYRQDELTTYDYLCPQAAFEIGQLYRSSGDHKEAKLWFKKAKSHSGYLTESMIHFRSDCALQTLKKTK